MGKITSSVEAGSRASRPVGSRFHPLHLITMILALGLVAAVATAQGVNPQSILVGNGRGALPQVRIFDGGKLALTETIVPFDAKGRGLETRVATGDVNGDGVADIIVGAGAGGGPHVKVFSGATGALLADFFAFPVGFQGGIFVAAGDINNDGFADIITGADAGGGPHVRIFDLSNANLGPVLHGSIAAFDPSFKGGVRVAAGDVTGDGTPDIIVGAGPGGGPHVRVFSGANLSLVQSFFAYPAHFRGGIFVATGDIDGDGVAEIITGAGMGGGPHVKVFDARSGQELSSFFAYSPQFHGGVRVATGDVTGDGVADIITGTGPGGGAEVRIFDGTDHSLLGSFQAYDRTHRGGVNKGDGGGIWVAGMSAARITP